MISHFFVPFFLLVFAPLFISISLLLPLCNTLLHTHIHTLPTATQCIWASPLSSLSKTSPTTSIFPPFPQLTRYFSLFKSLPPPFLSALPPFFLSFRSLYLSPAWCVVVRGGVLTWHWVCSAHQSTAAGGRVRSSGVRVFQLWSAVLKPLRSFGIQTWSSSLQGWGGDRGERGFNNTSCSLHSSLTHSGALFLSSLLLLLCSPLFLCLNAYIKYTDSG